MVPEASKSLSLDVDSKIKHFHDDALEKLLAAEQKITKNKNSIDTHSKLIEDNTENITNIISTNATFSSQINSMETKSEDFLQYLQIERQRIDNLGSDLQVIDENLRKTVPEVKRNTDRLDGLDTNITNLGKKVDNINNNVQDNDREIESVKEKILQQDKNLSNVQDNLRETDVHINNIEEKIDGLYKTVEIFEGRHVETVEKMKEVTVLVSNIQVQIKAQEEQIMEKSANDLTQIKNQLQIIENKNEFSDQKIKELDTGSQALLEKLISLEREFGDRFVSLDKTDDSLLAKINSLDMGNMQNMEDMKNIIEKRLGDLEDKLQVDHDSLRKETLVLVHEMNTVKTQNTYTEKKFIEIDAGNQQLLEKLLGVEKDLDGQLKGVHENTNTIETKLNSIDEENKNITQNIVNIYESIRIQTDQVQKVDAERQQADAKAKEDVEANAASNAKAIDDLRNYLTQSITNVEITLKQDQEKETSSLAERLIIVQNTGESNENRIDSLEKMVPEASKSLSLDVDSKIKHFHDDALEKLLAAEQKITKNKDSIDTHSKLIEDNTENITNIISTNATFSSQINSMETKAEDFLQYLQIERQRIDNLASDLQVIDENLRNTVPEVKRNTDRLDDLDTNIANLGQKVDNINNNVQDNDREIESVKEKNLQQDKNLSTVQDNLRDTNAHINNIEEKMDSLYKTVEIFEGRNVETLEKMKEVTVLVSNIQVQIKAQEEHIMEKSANDLTQIKNQLQDIENKNAFSDQKIKELDTGSQALLEKLIILEREFGDRFVSLDKTDDSLLAKINSLDIGNMQNMEEMKKIIEKRFDDLEDKLNVYEDSLRKETLVLVHDMNSVKTQNKYTENKFVEYDEGNQQLLEKLQGVEKYLDGKLQGVHENTSTLRTELGSIDAENKNNTQNILNIHESIRIQIEQVQKVDAEMQHSSAKVKEDFEFNTASNAKAIDDLRKEVSDSIDQIEISLKKEQDENISSVYEKIKYVDNSLSTTTKEIMKISETTSRYSQHIQTLEILGDKIDHYDEIILRNNSQLKQDFIDNISKNSEDMKHYVQVNLDELEKMRHKEQSSLANDNYLLAKQLEEVKSQHRLMENRVVDINTDQQQISINLTSIQQHYENRFQSINENESSFISKLNVLDEENKSNLEKIIAMQEVSMIQAEKAKYIESLTTRVNQIDEMRQNSEAKAKEDFDKTVSKNAKDIQDLKLNLENTLTMIEQHMKEENNMLKSENSNISIQVKLLQDDASKQNQQLIQLLKEKSELEMKLEENIKESGILKQKGDALKNTLANYEDIIDKRINQLQKETESSSQLLSDIEPKINQVHKSLFDFESKTNGKIEEIKVELSHETKEIINLMRIEVDNAFVANVERVAEFEKAVQSLREDNETSFKENEKQFIHLISSSETMFSNITTIETKIESIDLKQRAIAENLLITSEAQLNEIRNKFDAKITELMTRTNTHSELLDEADNRMVGMTEQSSRIGEDLFHTQRDVEELKRNSMSDKELVVLKIKEQKETLESFFKSLEQKMEIIETTQIQESSRVEIIEKQTESQERLAVQLEKKIQRVERFGEEQNSLILAVEKTTSERMEDFGTELSEYISHSREDIHNIRSEMVTDKDNFWTLLVEIYSAFRGYTVVIKSEGPVTIHQADVLGVYRMVDSYNDRPVYKQDGGENYIYYSAGSSTWFVGTVVGHQYGWLRNGSEAATSRRWLPDLSSGWEYRPLVRSSGLASLDNNTWLSDDGTLRIESLRDVEKVNELIRDITTDSKDVQ